MTKGFIEGANMEEKKKSSNFDFREIFSMQDEDGDTPLHYCVYYKDDKKTIKLIDLISKKFLPALQIQNRYGQTVLHAATLLEKLDIVQSLICHGIDQTIVDCTGKTAFQMACTMNNLELIKALTDRNFHESMLRCTDFTGETILHSALKSRSRNQILSYLLNTLGADVNMKDSRSGRNIFHLLAEEGDIELFQHLLDITTTADLHARTFSGHSIIQLAIGWRNERLVEYLCKIGINNSPFDLEDEDDYSESDSESDADLHSEDFPKYFKTPVEKDRFTSKSHNLDDFVNISISR